jgi:WD40 repeat protein
MYALCRRSACCQAPSLFSTANSQASPLPPLCALPSLAAPTLPCPALPCPCSPFSPQAFPGHKDAVTGLAFREGTHQLFSASLDRSVKIWSLDDMAYVDTLFGHQSEVGLRGWRGFSGVREGAG